MQRTYYPVAELNESERHYLESIEKFGFQSVHVFGDQDEPGFTYSVGFTSTLGASEFIIFGLNRDTMHSMLWDIFEQIKAGKKIVDGARWSDLIDNYDCVSRTVHHTNIQTEYLNSAIWYWESQLDNDSLLPVMQIVWPGSPGFGEGLFPWEDGCHDEIRRLQRPLYLPRPSHD
jgi:Domain of unknown function (DUF4262)